MDIYKPLVALLAIVNPVGVVPFFIHFTSSFTRKQRQRTIQVSCFSAFLVIAISALAGLQVIEFFSISLASFQVGGGTLLLISSIQMLNAQPAEAKKSEVTEEGSTKVDAGASIAVVPLTIPLLTGPATISTMIIYADKTRHWWELAILVGYGVVVAAVTFIVFSASGRIARVLGQTGINIMTRLMGLILAALAVELLADGLTKIFPVLGSHIG
ncbi:MarC family protein [Pelomonas sp. KK5]|uniref:MarC family protein n=1 Tax=Pelomonas sp. KK5 TaxID=1855730 RepID=UPI00097BD734|nr:MarC family protein [Pelomonas sp. KK5]